MYETVEQIREKFKSEYQRFNWGTETTIYRIIGLSEKSPGMWYVEYIDGKTDDSVWESESVLLRREYGSYTPVKPVEVKGGWVKSDIQVYYDNGGKIVRDAGLAEKQTESGCNNETHIVECVDVSGRWSTKEIGEIWIAYWPKDNTMRWVERSQSKTAWEIVK